MKKNICNLLIIIGFIMIIGCGKDKADILKGNWRATVDNQRVYEVDGKIIGGVEEYILKCDGKGHYDLTTQSNDLANARYSIKKDVVTFYDEGKKVLAICKINDNELDCDQESYYAFRYMKVE